MISRIQFAQKDLFSLFLDQKIQFEVAAISLRTKLFAEAKRIIPRLGTDARRKGAGKQFVAAPAAAIGRQVRESDKFGHQRTDDRAVARRTGLNSTAAAAQSAHDLDFRLSFDLVR